MSDPDFGGGFDSSFGSQDADFRVCHDHCIPPSDPCQEARRSDSDDSLVPLIAAGYILSQNLHGTPPPAPPRPKNTNEEYPHDNGGGWVGFFFVIGTFVAIWYLMSK